MKNILVSPPNLSVLLQKCLKSKALAPSKQIHALLLTSCIDMNILSLHSKLIGSYAASGDLTSANRIFQNTENPNVFAYNWLISAFTFHGFHQEAIGYFSSFQKSTFYSPNKYTFSTVLKACVGLLDVKKGKELHSMIYKLGSESDVIVNNALIDMYTKCGNIEYGCVVFDKMPVRDVASWTSLISGYCNAGKMEKSVVLFDRMSLEGLKPNDFTWNAMISGYAKKGDIDNAFVLFSRMSKEGLVPDLVTWNAIISGLVHGEEFDKALEMLHDMLIVGIKPNQVTIAGILPACGKIGSIRRGKEIHGLIYRISLPFNVFVGSSLIDMYSKCGSVNNARCVFNAIPVKNVVIWNAMIGCYGKHGMVEKAVEFFEMMECEGVKANEVTFTCVLSACGHGDLVDKGLSIFKSMRECYSVEPSKEHYACVIDLLSRCGWMNEAYATVMEMSTIEVTDSIVGAFFNGCKIHERKDLAEKMADNILKMELKKPGGFVTLSNIYATKGQWNEVEYVRNVMKDKGVVKLPGSSWIKT